jgi:hypothetical protein
MRPQLVAKLHRVVLAIGPLMPVLIVLIVHGKRW